LFIARRTEIKLSILSQHRCNRSIPETWGCIPNVSSA